MTNNSMLMRAHASTQRKKLRRPMRMTASISLGMRTLRGCWRQCGSPLKSSARLRRDTGSQSTSVWRRLRRCWLAGVLAKKRCWSRVAGQELRIVKQYKHRGSMRTPGGAMGLEVSWSVARTRVAYLAVAGRFFAAANFSLKCKKSVAATLVETRLLYSSETWPPLPMGHAKRLEGGADEVDAQSCETTSW